jgi:general nucleoside transport system ATP-binding protein
MDGTIRKWAIAPDEFTLFECGAKLAGATDRMTALLTLRGLGKAFPGVVANAAIDLEVGRGEIHALLGENGAGKSTLVKMIFGALRPDTGSMTFDGTPYAPARPFDARARGIGMIFQHFSLFDSLSVTDNIALGLTAAQSRGDLAARIMSTARTYGLAVEPARLAGTLSAGERQRVEIVRCLLQKPRLIIMDEPTSVLTPDEAASLFTTLHQLAAEGRSILYISHKLEEIRALCSRATVLRAGRVVASLDPRMASAKQLAELMLGQQLNGSTREPRTTGAVRLTISNLSQPALDPFGVALDRISLDVRAGEIVGIAGVAGNGQSELMTALIGERYADRADALTVATANDTSDIGHLGPNQRRTLGLAFVPEQRLGHGAVPHLTLAENVLLSASDRQHLTRGGIINRCRRNRFASDIVARFGVRTAGVDQPAASLSGGNLQKFLVGREIMQAPTVLIAAQPTWGVDAGAAAFIHEQLTALAASGAAVLLISQDLDELLALSDRIAVIAGGRLSLARPVAELTLEMIGQEMGGIGVSTDVTARTAEADHAAA